VRVFLAIMLATAPGCSSDGDAGPAYFSPEQMRDPESCKDCHPKHYEEWSGSMHAYASYDPVFLAINRRGQRETGGELGDFCVQCHAPMALRLGLTEDGLNLEELPTQVQGITCFFCHTVDAVEGTHNNPLRLAGDLVMRGAYADPVANEAHASAYSPLLDRENIKSSDLCGSCHDIVTPKGVHLERTFEEWKTSLFSHEIPDEQQTCGSCHTKGRDDVAADAPNVFLRRVHSHEMVGVDVALTPFPQMERQAARIQRELDTAVSSQICVAEVDGRPNIDVVLENFAAGHSWPSGAAQDRRAWVEVIAYDAAGETVFQSGVVADGQAVADINDPQLWTLGDRGYDADGNPAHFFWDIERIESELLPAPTAHSVTDLAFTDIHRWHNYNYAGEMPAAVAMRVRIRPIGLDILDDLIDTGDLDAAYRDLVPTFDIGFTRIQWHADDRVPCEPETMVERIR
jgi:hypothetical protein